ncbi:MAG: DNA polymerase III subunit alpha, partial [Bacteroidota bacterium]
TLFKQEWHSYQTPPLLTTSQEDAFDEMELLGFPLSSPFNLLTDTPKTRLKARDLDHHIGRSVNLMGYLVTTKNTSTSKGARMYFGTFLDDEGDFIDTVHFPPVAKKYPFRGKGIYQITGRVIEEFDCVSVEVSKMEKCAIIEDPRYNDKIVKNDSR